MSDLEFNANREFMGISEKEKEDTVIQTILKWGLH